MAKVLVTGGAGYVGSVCCSELLASGHEVTILDDLSTGHIEAVPAGAEFIRLDISDRHRLEQTIAHRRFDVVFHFAAKALIAESVTNPGTFFDANVSVGIGFLEVLRKAQVRNFVFSSSAAVYGNPQQVPIPEDHPKDPVNAYGESKLMLERVLQWYASAYGWSVVAFRYFNACGAHGLFGERHSPETHIIPLLLHTASGQRERFAIFGDDYPTPDGTCLRDYVHVRDISVAHLLALRVMNDPGFRAYNIGTGTSFSVREIVSAAEQVTGKKIETVLVGRRAGDPAVLCASATKIEREFGWKAKHSDLRCILESAWEWERSNLGARKQLINS